MNLDANTEAEITRIFGSESPDLISKIKSSDFSLGSMSADRIVLAILFGSKGDPKKFDKLIELSSRDWRDTLMSAGLAGPDWREVLKSHGYWAPEDIN